VSWLAVHGGAELFAKLEPLASGRSSVVLAVCLVAAIPSAVSGLYLMVAVGYGAHRLVGLARIATGLIAAGCIASGALLFGVVGAACGTLIRDATILVVARRISFGECAVRYLPRHFRATPT
jgi:hypothetical protein